MSFRVRITTSIATAVFIGFGFFSIHSAAQAQPESSKRYMVTHNKGDGARAEKAAKKLAKFARRLKRRNALSVEMNDKQLKKLRRHPLFAASFIEEDPRRYLLADNN